MSDGSGPSGIKRCDCGDPDCETDRLWGDFESCAGSVTRLYREPHWKTLQSAAAATTQLYKNGLDGHRKGYDRGFQAGRQSLAKEVLTSFGNKVDMATLLNILSKYVLISDAEMNAAKQYAEFRKPVSPPLSSESAAAVHLFQQALSPNPSSSPQRSPDLNAFLAAQLQRRKRTHSPSSPAALLKRFRRQQ